MWVVAPGCVPKDGVCARVCVLESPQCWTSLLRCVPVNAPQLSNNNIRSLEDTVAVVSHFSFLEDLGEALCVCCRAVGYVCVCL